MGVAVVVLAIALAGWLTWRDAETDAKQAAKPAVQCEAYSIDRAASILSESDVAVIRAAAVRSTEHSKAWYVAIRFRGPGIESGEVGVWATNDLAGGSIIAVDGFAKQFSNFPPDDGFSTTDAGASAARSCV